MDQTGTVVSLQILTAHRTRPQRVREVRALVDHGLEGDIHGKQRAGSRRQMLMLDQRVLAAFGLEPGDLREQITVDFPSLDALPAGSLLRIGQVTCELTASCTPCTHIGGLLGVVDPAALQKELDGRRGQLARIVQVQGDGLIRVGDAVVPEAMPLAAPASPRLAE